MSVDDVVIGTGALNRNEPTGGTAYGIPNHDSVPLKFVIPLKVPEVSFSSSEFVS